MKVTARVCAVASAVVCAAVLGWLPASGQAGGPLVVESATKVRPRSSGRYTGLADYLKLDDGQRKKLGMIIRDEQVKLTKVKDEALQKAATVRRETDGEIGKILRPEQQQKFDEMRERKRELLRKKVVAEKMNKQ